MFSKMFIFTFFKLCSNLIILTCIKCRWTSIEHCKVKASEFRRRAVHAVTINSEMKARMKKNAGGMKHFDEALCFVFIIVS